MPPRKGQKQAETPPPTTGPENPKTAMKRTKDTPFLEPVPGPSYAVEIQDQTPEISSHESEYDPGTTPSRVQSRSKGKRPADHQSEDEESGPHADALLKIIQDQREEIQRLKNTQSIGATSHTARASPPPEPAEDLVLKQVDRYEKRALATLAARIKVLLRPNNYTE